LTDLGEDLAGHQKRFDSGGQYYPLITSGKIVKWLILDYRSASKKVNESIIRPNVIHILYNDDYSVSQIFKSGSSSKKVVQLLGSHTTIDW
jgi:hypothetical protein